MNILLTFDNNYSQHAGVVIASFFANNAGTHTVYVISDYISEHNQQLLRRITSTHNCQIEFNFINTNIIEEFPIGKGTANTYVSIATYFRLFITEVISDSIDKILYLDCDVVVDKPLDAIWNHTFADGCCILALEEMQILASDGCKRLHYPESYSYFNAGVLLINLRELRDAYTLDDAIDYIKHNNIKFHDQDVLNGMLYDKKQFLHLQFNVMDSFLIKNAKFPERYQHQRKSLYHPAIIHFSGPIKPWHKECNNPYTDRYYYYLQQTPWKGYTPVCKYQTAAEKTAYFAKKTVKWMLETLRIRRFSFISVKQNKTHIAIDCRLIGMSGIGTYIENIVFHVTNREEFNFVLIGNKDSLSAYYDRNNCRIIECTHKSFTLKELFCFPIKEVNKCDAFFTPNFNIPFGIKVPIFCTIHDMVFFDIKGICSPIGKSIRRAYIKRALKISKSAFTVSNFSKKRISEIFNSTKEITVIYNGISQELITYRQMHPKVHKEDYIVCLGNLKRYKGVKDLIEAYYKAQKSIIENYTLYIIGRIDFRTKDKEAIRLLRNSSQNIQFVTNADNHKVYELLAGARALISPSKYEGFGIPPLEAMYLHTPVIISDIPTHLEIYKETPAIFFRTGDVENLAYHLQRLPTEECNIDTLVNSKYNYQKTAELILEKIQEDIGI